MTELDSLTVAQDSYDRCCAAPDFFQTFYRLLLDSSPVIPLMFVDTDFEKQNKLLQHAIGLLLIYAKRKNPALLERLAIRHSQQDLDVDPSLYPLFGDSLIAAVKRHDPECSAEVETAWRVALAPGIEFMGKKY